jgi:hypothetical protein
MTKYPMTKEVRNPNDEGWCAGVAGDGGWMRRQKKNIQRSTFKLRLVVPGLF